MPPYVCALVLRVLLPYTVCLALLQHMYKHFQPKSTNNNAPLYKHIAILSVGNWLNK